MSTDTLWADDVERSYEQPEAFIPQGREDPDAARLVGVNGDGTETGVANQQRVRPVEDLGRVVALHPTQSHQSQYPPYTSPGAPPLSHQSHGLYHSLSSEEPGGSQSTTTKAPYVSGGSATATEGSRSRHRDLDAAEKLHSSSKATEAYPGQGFGSLHPGEQNAHRGSNTAANPTGHREQLQELPLRTSEEVRGVRPHPTVFPVHGTTPTPQPHNTNPGRVAEDDGALLVPSALGTDPAHCHRRQVLGSGRGPFRGVPAGSGLDAPVQYRPEPRPEVRQLGERSRGGHQHQPTHQSSRPDHTGMGPPAAHAASFCSPTGPRATILDPTKVLHPHTSAGSQETASSQNGETIRQDYPGYSEVAQEGPGSAAQGFEELVQLGPEELAALPSHHGNQYLEDMSKLMDQRLDPNDNELPPTINNGEHVSPGPEAELAQLDREAAAAIRTRLLLQAAYLTKYQPELGSLFATPRNRTADPLTDELSLNGYLWPSLVFMGLTSNDDMPPIQRGLWADFPCSHQHLVAMSQRTVRHLPPSDERYSIIKTANQCSYQRELLFPFRKGDRVCHDLLRRQVGPLRQIRIDLLEQWPFLPERDHDLITHIDLWIPSLNGAKSEAQQRQIQADFHYATATLMAVFECREAAITRTIYRRLMNPPGSVTCNLRDESLPGAPATGLELQKHQEAPTARGVFSLAPRLPLGDIYYGTPAACVSHNAGAPLLSSVPQALDLHHHALHTAPASSVRPEPLGLRKRIHQLTLEVHWLDRWTRKPEGPLKTLIFQLGPSGLPSHVVKLLVHHHSIPLRQLITVMLPILGIEMDKIWHRHDLGYCRTFVQGLEKDNWTPIDFSTSTSTFMVNKNAHGQLELRVQVRFDTRIGVGAKPDAQKPLFQREFLAAHTGLDLARQDFLVSGLLGNVLHGISASWWHEAPHYDTDTVKPLTVTDVNHLIQCFRRPAPPCPHALPSRKAAKIKKIQDSWNEQ